jgi:heptosyltransferase-1
MIKRILFIKLTSLGDLIHALPALSDALSACPEIEFDWLIDENFSEIASWHPAVRDIFITNHRTWRKHLLKKQTLQTISDLIKTLRKRSYDLIIDGQGNFKSAFFTCVSRGVKAGYDRHSISEWIAHLSYEKKYAISKQSHAIDRLRRLFAYACGYPLPLSTPHFQINVDRFINPNIPLPKDYLVFIHNATWKTKLWPESYWIELIRKAVADGFSILLPWGNAEEEARAKRLSIDPRVIVLPRLSLSKIGYILLRARSCVSMDTGLSHLAAALSVPTITLYGSTNSGLIGASGEGQVHLVSTAHCSPCEKKKCRYSDTDSPCLKEITPDCVYKELLRQASLRYL